MDQNIPTQQPPATPQTPPVQQPPIMESVPEKKPIFSIIAGVIVIVAIAGYIALASFYNLWPFSYTEPEMEATPTPRADATSSWEKYENQEFSYSFEYPSNYLIEEIDDNNIALRLSGNDGPADLLVNVTQDSRSLDAIIQDKAEGFLFRDYRRITISGKDAYEGIGQGIINSYEILVKSKGNLYSLSFESGNGDTLEQNKAGLDQVQKTILSTFDLID